MCIKYASDEDSASDCDTPVHLYDVVDWELLPTGLGSINAIYRLDNSRKYFTSLREILHLVTRADLMTIYGRVMTFYQDKKAEGVGLVLWGDLKILMDSPEVNDGSDFWKNQHTWSIQNWKLYSFSGVHVLETVSGLVIHMFVDKKYPLTINLIERMLDHQLEICHGTVGNELTTAVQLIAFLKKQISDSKRPKVHEWYVVPTSRVKVPTSRYVVPTGKDNVIVSTGKTKVIQAGRTILVLVVLCLLRVDSKGKIKMGGRNPNNIASCLILIIHQMDVKTAFLDGKLDEVVNMNQHQGFIMHGNKDKVDLIKEFLSLRFSMKYMEEADVILGLILLSVGKLSRYTRNPSTHHWQGLLVAKPTNLEGAFALARVTKARLDDQRVLLVSNMTTTMTSKGPLRVTSSRIGGDGPQSEWKKRLSKGLCFKCDNKWVRDHKNDAVERSTISLALGNGWCEDVHVLIDNGSMHNFIWPDVVEKMCLPEQPTKAFKVYIGSRETLWCEKLFS
ncbi:anticodon-binding aminoacyl-tRNA synthetase, class 1a [Tanacetum coccineum]|uniref:Anticodon-binding aminoacyl-tRNA synthetase, class 1a n=1 Tax=Tanacetum coccineum TaxID=301880 RepID=A0ABQ5GY53_9ASTR